MLTETLSPHELRTFIPLAPGTRMSDEELMRFSLEHKPYRFERDQNGEIIMMSPTGGIGSSHEFYVAAMFGLWVEQDGTGIGFSPTGGFNLPDGWLRSPDVAWISKERWQQLTPPQQSGFLPLCPDFLIEIRSQSDSRPTLEAKMQQWIANGAHLAWLIDPIDATVTIYRPNEPTETLERPDLVTAHAPIAGFTLRTTRLWPTP